MATAIGTETSTDLVTANATSGVVTLTASTWGTGGNSYTLSQNAASGVSTSAFSGGANGTNTGSSFAIDNVNADAATNLASAITRNGGTVGVTASSNNATVTVTATTAGTGGNGITLAEALSNFTWSGNLSGGSNGATSGTSSPPTFAYWSGSNYALASAVATNIATAINANTTVNAVLTATANSPVSGDVLLTAKTPGPGGNSYAVSESAFSAFTPANGDLSGGAVAAVQPNTSPAKYSFSTTSASCSDFVVYPTGAAGASSAANIIAYDNLYSGTCTSGNVPSVDWAYNTGGTVTTSPILSYWDNGAQVAFIQVSGTTASLVLLKWAASGGSVTSPTTLTSQSSGSNYRSCTAPCMYSVALSGSPNDTLSAPFYDYYNDLLYVGDDSGNLHQFSGAFEGSPAENTTSPWPVHLGSNKLSSPVYDSEEGFQGGYVFVGDMGGVFYSVGTGYGGTTNGQIHGNTGSLGDAIADAPLVDSSEGIELVFVTTDGSSKPYSGGNGVFEFVSSFTVYGTPGVVSVGTGGTGYYLYAGDFDNVYYQSGNPAYGHLYVVGNTGVQGGATLYQVEIAYSSLSGTVNSVATGLNSTEYPWPSPLTEFCNNGANSCAITSQRSVTGNLNTNNSTSHPGITLTSGSFTSADVGAVVTGTDIPFGDTISSVLSSSTANLTTAPSATATGISLAIQGGQTTTGTDYVFFSVNSPASGLCKTSSGAAESGAGWGCILSYNVNSPTAVARSGTGLAVTDPSSNGCWATGGLVIDNSAATAGASQIYFVNLNGAAAGGPTGTTQTSTNCTGGAAPTINAVQAAQSSP
jgi:hypothetical protein